MLTQHEDSFFSNYTLNCETKNYKITVCNFTNQPLQLIHIHKHEHWAVSRTQNENTELNNWTEIENKEGKTETDGDWLQASHECPYLIGRNL